MAVVLYFAFLYSCIGAIIVFLIIISFIFKKSGQMGRNKTKKASQKMSEEL